MTKSLLNDRPMVAFVILTVTALFLPIGDLAGQSVSWMDNSFAFSLVLLSLILGVYQLATRNVTYISAFIMCFCVFLGAGSVLSLIDPAISSQITDRTILEFFGSTAALWVITLGVGFAAWRAMELMSAKAAHSTVIAILVPTLFGLWLLYLWQVVTTGFAIPSVLLPSPVQIGAALSDNTDTLMRDFYQTFVKSVLRGFAIGCGSGFLVAIMVDKIPFLQRGLLPLGSLVSAIPIVGIAPIMVMWFGFDWQSKAAVIVVMTFFPMLVNTLAGLEATGRLEKDLMRSYAATYFQTLIFVRLPNALPFIFNALKINSTLALIGAIVAEFFGTPIVGMGFRISTEVGRMNVDIVWASIAVAALAGSLFYGIIALIERRLTFWHPSYRGSRK
ncbi:MAG: ABC transporter permease [Sneathiella sp.]|nr:ABC transporter permease [Sneathiella sp.]